MLGVDRCCKRQTLFKCHKSQTECPECSKTPGRRSGTPPLLSALRALASSLQASRRGTSTSVLGHFGPRSLQFFFRGPNWLRTEVTEDRFGWVTSVPRTELHIRRTDLHLVILHAQCFEIDDSGGKGHSQKHYKRRYRDPIGIHHLLLSNLTTGHNHEVNVRTEQCRCNTTLSDTSTEHRQRMARKDKCFKVRQQKVYSTSHT